MNQRSIIITLGILVALFPFLGFPGGVKTTFFVLAGLAIVVSEYIYDMKCEKCDDKDTKNDGVREDNRTKIDKVVAERNQETLPMVSNEEIDTVEEKTNTS